MQYTILVVFVLMFAFFGISALAFLAAVFKFSEPLGFSAVFLGLGIGSKKLLVTLDEKYQEKKKSKAE